MARYESKSMKRKGSVFYTERLTAEYDLTGLRFLARGIDTIRQLYNCSIRPDIFDQVSNHWDCASTDVLTIGGIDWKLSSSGKSAGYKYILKNLDAGVVVLFKSMYCEVDKHGGHLKIEATPQLIDQLGLEQLTDYLRSIGSLFAETLEASGCAVHLFCDMKGLELPDDFEQKLVTHSKRNLKVNGISEGHFSASEASFVYGKGQTYMFGSSGSLQLCIYDKTLEATKSDKLSFIQPIWRECPSLEDPFVPEYKDGSDGDEADTVHRVEFRLHHSVIKSFENGRFNETQQLDDLGNVVEVGDVVSIREPRDLKKHLQGIWLYCLNNFRLQHSTTYIHPIWQALQEDVRWFGLLEDWGYKRSTKKSPGVVSRRNVAMWVGNWLRLAARRGFTPEFVTGQIMASGMESEIADYFGMHWFGNSSEVTQCLLDFVSNRMRDHRLSGVGGLNVA